LGEPFDIIFSGAQIRLEKPIEQKGQRQGNDHLGNFGHVRLQAGLDDQCREGALRADAAVDLRLDADQYVTTTSGLGSNHFI
jgi:hypothetical protein